MTPRRDVTPRRDARPYLAGAVSGLVAGVLGVAWTDAALFGLVVLVAALAGVAVVPRGATHRWPQARPPERDGARREVADVTWTFAGSHGRVSEQAVRRLRADATRRLARRGVVLAGGLGPGTPASADPATAALARSLLGDRAWRILTSPGGRMPSLADVAHCVDVVEHLLDPAVQDPAVQDPRPTRAPGGPNP